MSLWSIWSAPLLMSNDLKAVPASSKQLLQNKGLLEVNQDSLGRMVRILPLLHSYKKPEHLPRAARDTHMYMSAKHD